MKKWGEVCFSLHTLSIFPFKSSFSSLQLHDLVRKARCTEWVVLSGLPGSASVFSPPGISWPVLIYLRYKSLVPSIGFTRLSLPNPRERYQLCFSLFFKNLSLLNTRYQCGNEMPHIQMYIYNAVEKLVAMLIHTHLQSVFSS